MFILCIALLNKKRLKTWEDQFKISSYSGKPKFENEFKNSYINLEHHMEKTTVKQVGLIK